MKSTGKHISGATILLAIQILASFSLAEYLRVDNKQFKYGGQTVVLSGPNIAWVSYGYDFGNGQYYGSSGAAYRQSVDEIAGAGGNTLRFWLHVEGENTPEFDSDGFVTAPDREGSLINELSEFLDYAAEKNVFVIITLWNGAVMRPQRFINLVWDETKLQSYIDNALRPMVRALSNKPALAAWEVMNEPEGSVRIEGNSNPCYDTTMIGQHGAGWTGTAIPMDLFLRFINRHSSAIRQEDPKALVTLGSWSEHPQSDVFSDTVNYYKDSCLISAGGKADGTIDFYQMHTYSWQGSWSTNAPFRHAASDYNLDKPLIIGEFASVCAMNEGIQALFEYAYNNNYNGILSWQYNGGGECSDSKETQNNGMRHIKDMTHNGVIGVEIQ